MKDLTDKQINEIESFLVLRIKNNTLRQEILDHICSSVELHMSNHESEFQTALEQVLADFGYEEFQKLDHEIKKQKQRRFMVKKLPWISGSMAACLTFLVLAVDAQQRPEIVPLEPDQFKISSEFGKRFHPILREEKFHQGIDLLTPMYSPVRVTADGVVEKISTYKDGTIYVRVGQWERIYYGVRKYR